MNCSQQKSCQAVSQIQFATRIAFSLCLAVTTVSFAGCQAGRAGMAGYGQPYGNYGQVPNQHNGVQGYQQPYQQPGIQNYPQPTFQQGVQQFGRNFGNRLANGAISRGVNGVLNAGFRMLGL